jgi:hypothetical protein
MRRLKPAIIVTASILALVAVSVALATAALRSGSSPSTATPSAQPYSKLKQSYLIAAYDEINSDEIGWHVLRSNDAGLLRTMTGRIEDLGTDHPTVVLSYGTGPASITMIESQVMDPGAVACASNGGALEQIGVLTVQWFDQQERTFACFLTGEQSTHGLNIRSTASATDPAFLRKFLLSLSRSAQAR